ncbi:MAG TPA: hypothetical protein VF660_03330, partial [Actinomycetota bacterium]
MSMTTLAWEPVHDAAARAGVTITELTEFEDAARVGRVIAAIWGEESVLAPPLIRAFQHAGNVLFGATAADGELVGFVFGFLGFGEGVHV